MMNTEKLRNIAIIAHVDHGKTTLVDGLLKQAKTFRENEALMSAELIMDSNDQERERGITIVAKNTAVTYKDYKINIIDTPGHADFGGEVERTLNMADGALLLVDAQEGPMPQTKFVLKKAMETGIKIIVVINKIDKKDARIDYTINKISDLFLELATTEDQLDFPIIYCIGREGKSWTELPTDTSEECDFTPIFETIIHHIPAPKVNDKAFQMLITTLDWDSYKGKYSIGRILSGNIKPGQEINLVKGEKIEKAVIDKVFVSQGLKRIETDFGMAGDIVALTGIKNAGIGDTISDLSLKEALPSIKLEEPTLSISLGPNTSPFMGKEGKFLTSRQILERIEKELQTNIAMKFNILDDGSYVISGRGELHISVFLETLRREGFEISVGKPRVITKKIDGVEMEPVEELLVDIDNNFVGAVKSEVGKRKGMIIYQEEISSSLTRLVFEITTRGLLGLRGVLMTLTKGTAIISSTFLRYDPLGQQLQKLRKGVLIATAQGKATTYGIHLIQDKGPIFVNPADEVYEGMIIGINGRDEDLEVNVCKEKALSNVRSVGEEGLLLTPPTIFSLEQCLDFLEDDELLEVTPTKLRLRKKTLSSTQRSRERKR
ncbi:translational GTPase TypA [bacterium]|nr:translational GTPase TypA [bacterium]